MKQVKIVTNIGDFEQEKIYLVFHPLINSTF